MQDLTVDGAQGALQWNTGSDPRGQVAAVPDEAGVTGCYVWTDPATGRQDWAARISGSSGGHEVSLLLRVDGQDIPPTGTHATDGAQSTDGRSGLTVDGVPYLYVHRDPADAVPSYFDVEGGGDHGVISVRFAAASGGAQSFEVSGSWRCA